MSSQVARGFVAVMPSFRGFRGAVTSESKAAGAAGAKSVATGFSGVGKSAGSRVGKDFKSAFASNAKGLAGVELKAMQADVASASQALSKIRLKQQDEAGKVRTAEAQLAEAIAKTGEGSARAIGAEERLEAARRRHKTVTDEVTEASKRLKTAQEGVANVKVDGSSMSGLRDAVTSVGDRAGAAGKAIVDGIGSGIQAASQMAAAGLLALGTQAVAITKGAVSEYATWEQAVGGIDTLFKDASGTVQGFADEAFKTAGVSANEYMTQVTSFSASLISSLDGDTTAAAEVANQAMIDMSDNANKMGTDIASIQNTYQGFAKQNYTMLDNLKLGYGGTKTEMERLLEDAAKISGIEYNIDSFSDVVEAIHVVQDELGITGTTALEAAETIEGSIGAMKGAWSNWLTELGKSDGDIAGVSRNLTETVGAVLENLIPRIKEIIINLGKSIPSLLWGAIDNFLPPEAIAVVEGFSEKVDGLTSFLGPLAAGFGAIGAVGILPLLSGLPVVGGLFGTLATKLPLLTNPLFIAAAGLAAFGAAGGDFGQIGDLVTGLLDSLLGILPGLYETLVQVVPEIVSGILAAVPQLLDAATSIVTALVGYIVEGLPIVIEAGVALIDGILTAIVDNLPMIIEAAVTLVTTLLEGIITALPLLIQGGIQLLMGLIQGIIENLPMIIQAALSLINGLITAIVENLPLIIQAGIDLLIALLTGIIEALPLLLDGAIQLLLGLVQAIVENLPLIIEAGIGLLLSLVEGIWTALPQLLATVVELIFSIISTLLENLPHILTMGIDILLALITGLIDAIPQLQEAMPKIVKAIIDAIVEVDWIGLGVKIIEGLIEGIGSMMGAVGEAVGGIVEAISDWFPQSPAKKGPFSGHGWTPYRGKALVEGFAEGMEGSQRDVEAAADKIARGSVIDPTQYARDAANAVEARAKLAVAATYPSVAVSPDGRSAIGSVNRGGQAIEVHVHAAPGMSVDELVDAVMQKLNFALGGV